jgi:tetratricopeptide (TPR) repeat protein/GTPase SAR1 family protein
VRLLHRQICTTAMNLSTLRKMVIAGDMSAHALRYLLDCHGECEHLDFKALLHLESDYGRATFCRDVVAMKNVGGGYIVVGVEDKTWKPIGLAASFPADTKLLREMVRKVTGLNLEVDVVRHLVPVGDAPIELALILVRATAKRNKLRTPSVCSVDFCPKEDWGIRRGEIYVRWGDQTVRVSSETELAALLEDLAERQDWSALEQQETEPSPFWVESGFYRLLPREYTTFIGRVDLRMQAKQALERDPRIWIVNLYGPGGVGKSSLASWLAYHYYENQAFTAILQLSAKDKQLTTSGIARLRPTLYSLENLLDSILQLFGFGEFISASLEDRKALATELLNDYSTLLVLDNMETINDGRIMEYAQQLPATTKAKVLLTSRLRSSGWEMPVPVNELNLTEVQEFLEIKAREKYLSLPPDHAAIFQQVHQASGGLPLAIEWMLGKLALTHDWTALTHQVRSPDSPLLEFSFRSSWKVLDPQARTALAVLSIFEESPTLHLWATALEWSAEDVERAAAKLEEATFVSKKVDPKSGQAQYLALPITLAFARNELAKMGDLELTARNRYQRYTQEMALAVTEIERFDTLFSRFGVQRDTEKKAIILARRAEGQAATFNYDEAERLFKLALDEDPRSVYVLMAYGMLKSTMGQIGEALRLLEDAATRCTKQTGFQVFYNLSRVYREERNREQVARCLKKALEYQPKHSVARHQYGVILSQLGHYQEALAVFDELIQEELARSLGPTETLLFAYRAKITTLSKAGRAQEAQEQSREMLEKVHRWPHLAARGKEMLDTSED